MWDIKDLDNLAKAVKDAFHLNHVGYKECMKAVIERIEETFI